MVIGLSSCKQDELGVEIPANYYCERHSKSYDVFNFSRLTDLCFNESFLYRTECDIEKRAKFIVDCARAANPMSDEEGEDLVKECGRQSKMFCVKKYFKEINNN